MDMKELLTLTAFKEDPNKLQRLDQLKINYIVTIGSGPNRCRCLFLVRPPRLALAEGLRPSRLLRV